MKRTLTALGLTLAMSGFMFASAAAQTPPEVMVPYKAYRLAMASGNADAALSQSYAAWQAGEKTLGENKTTGDLAQNYARVPSADPATIERQIEAMKRAQELSVFYAENVSDVFMERGMKVFELQISIGETRKAGNTADSIIEYAEDKNLLKSVYLAEALTAKASVLSQKRNRRGGKRMVEYADRAITIFDKQPAANQSPYRDFAYLYRGFGHEYEDEIMEAALSYQNVLENMGDMSYENHPIGARALGRWIQMRARLRSEGDFETAKANGFRELFPYDVKRNETVKPVKRSPPKFSPKALRGNTSGFSVILFDLDDAGKTINHRILASWPPEIHEKTSVAAVEEWEYTPRQASEGDADRQNIITTIRYDLADGDGNPIY